MGAFGAAKSVAEVQKRRLWAPTKIRASAASKEGSQQASRVQQQQCSLSHTSARSFAHMTQHLALATVRLLQDEDADAANLTAADLGPRSPDSLLNHGNQRTVSRLANQNFHCCV